MNGVQNNSWKEYFKNKLENFYFRNELEKDGGVIFENYSAKNTDDQTQIIVGYLDDKLIILHFENPKSIGFTKQQEIEYFYANDFNENDSYGNPGLEFNENNVKAINKQLDFGLKGAEIQYFKNGKIIKSKIVIDQPNEYSTTINFEKKSFWQNLKTLFKKEDYENITKETIELNDIFGGIKNK